MGTTTRTRLQLAGSEEAPTIRWRAWPLLDCRPWSWLAPLGVLGMGGAVWYLGGGLLLATASMLGLAATLWQCFLPVDYEFGSLGLRRDVLGRTRLVPWPAVRAYRLRPTGVVLYRRADPTMFDLLSSMFVPYPPDDDEMLCAIRTYLAHAAELPNE